MESVFDFAYLTSFNTFIACDTRVHVYILHRTPRHYMIYLHITYNYALPTSIQVSNTRKARCTSKFHNLIVYSESRIALCPIEDARISLRVFCYLRAGGLVSLGANRIALDIQWP
jgi:hypothetical protein